MTRLPRPSTVTGALASLRVGEQRSLAARQLCQSISIWPASSLMPFAANAWAAAWARARSMLSPPSRMWSPTATPRQHQLAASSPTAISVKSVVPPPTSQTSDDVADLDLLRASFRRWSSIQA